MAPAATLTDPRKMVAVSRDSKVKPLGYIVWFSVPDVDVPLRKVKHNWMLATLDPRCLPKQPGDINAFKRAVRAEEGRVHLEGGGTQETDVRDIPTNDSFVTYQLSRVVKDVDEKLVSYPKALRVTFNRFTSEIEFKALGEVPRRDLLPIMQSIQESFDANSKSITGPKIRALVRDYIRDDDDEQQGKIGLSGENMRGKAGGVYFVLARYADQLESLGEFLAAMYPDADNAGLYYVPMADSASEREMIRRQHIANSISEIEAEMAEVRGLLREDPDAPDRKRGIREDVRQFHFRKLEQLKRRAAQYADALAEEQEDVNDRLDILNGQLRKLLGV